MRDFKKLKVWERSHRLSLEIYKLTADFPNHEIYGISNQLRRASTSIPANIAEGCGRGSKAELGRYLHIAKGSASELEYFILLIHDLGYCKKAEYEILTKEICEIKRMLTVLAQKIKE